MSVPSKKLLRTRIIRSLRSQGYAIRDGRISLPPDLDKDGRRRIHELAVAKRLSVAQPRMQRFEDGLLRYIANGDEVDPWSIRPTLHLVKPDTVEEMLFRYASLHWSIPVSSGYGRRLRFLVMDDSNGKLIGLFGLGDPVYALAARDRWVGWDASAKAKNLYHILDAYVLGAVPPYSFLLCGKLIALLTLSNEVREAFRHRYSAAKALISGAKREAHLAMLTTTSALGRSAIYNRIRVNGFDYWKGVGYTEGSGDFHFSNGVYADIRGYSERYCEATAKKEAWGTGFRNKREVVKKCLPKLGLSTELLYHGIRREVYLAPLAHNAAEFLRGDANVPEFYDWPSGQLSEIFRARWLLPRAERKPEYHNFGREGYRLWVREQANVNHSPGGPRP